MAITLRRSLDRAPAIRRSLLVARTTIDPSASIDVEGRTLGHSEDLETGSTELEGRHPFNSRLFFLYPTRDDLHRDLSFRSVSSASHGRKIVRNLLPFVPFSLWQQRSMPYFRDYFTVFDERQRVPSARDFSIPLKGKEPRCPRSNTIDPRAPPSGVHSTRADYIIPVTFIPGWEGRAVARVAGAERHGGYQFCF